MRRTSSALAITGLLATTAMSISACKHDAEAAAPRAPMYTVEGDRIIVPAGSPLRGKLVVGELAQDTIGRDLALPGIVEVDPARQDKVLPPLSGRIVRLGAALGDTVHAGQMLAVMTSPDLAQAIADEAKAKAQLALAARAKDRAAEVVKIGGAAEKDLQQAQNDYAAAQAEASRASARLHQIGGQDGRLTIRAPMSGVVTDLAVSAGSVWNDNTAALMTVTDTSTVWVTANVPEQNLKDVTKGQTVEISLAAYPDQVLHGRIQFVGAVLDPDTRRAKARIAIPNRDGRLKPGMFATVKLKSAGQSALTAPTSALILKDDANQMFVEVTPWVFTRRNVEIGDDQGDRTVILSGVAPGQRVITKGGVLLND